MLSVLLISVCFAIGFRGAIAQPTTCPPLTGTWYSVNDRANFQITSTGTNQYSAALPSGAVQFAVGPGLVISSPSGLSGKITDWCQTVFWSNANRWKSIGPSAAFTFADLNANDVALFEDATIGNDALQLNDFNVSSCGYAFYAPKVDVRAFNTSFTFRLTLPQGNRVAADGFALIIQDFALSNTYARGAVVFTGSPSSMGISQYESFPSAQFAAMAWIKPSQQQQAYILSMYSTVDAGATYGAFGVGLLQNGLFTVDVSGTVNNVWSLTTNVTVDVATWQHVAVTYNAGSDRTATVLSFYKNGVLMWQMPNVQVTLGSNPCLVVANKQNYNQGCFSVQNGFSYSGAMSDLQFTVATSPNSIMRSMTTPMFGYSGYYLDQVSSVAADVLGNQNLTLQNIGTGLDATLWKPLPMPDGGFLGYQGWPRSLAIEVDTWRNTEFNDAVPTHISVQTRGRMPNSADIGYSLQSRRLTTSIMDGKNHTISITYDGTYLLVYLDPAANGTSAPQIATQLSIADLLGLHSGRAWVGFSATSGMYWEENTMYAWSFSPQVPAPAPPPMTSAGSTTSGGSTGDHGDGGGNAVGIALAVLFSIIGVAGIAVGGFFLYRRLKKKDDYKFSPMSFANES